MRVHQMVTWFTVTLALIWTPITGILLLTPGKAQSIPGNPPRRPPIVRVACGAGLPPWLVAAGVVARGAGPPPAAARLARPAPITSTAAAAASGVNRVSQRRRPGTPACHRMARRPALAV